MAIEEFSAGVAPYIYAANKEINLKDGKIPIAPSKMTVTIQDVDYDSGRSQNGTMHRSRRAVKRKIELSFPAMKLAKATDILSKFTSVYIYVGYYDPLLNSMAKGKFYAGDRSIEMHNYTIGVYESFSFDLIEV